MKKINKYCKYCGKELSERHKTYCDTTCQHDYEYQEYIKRWKNGEEDGLRGAYQISNYLKRYIFEKFNNQCCKCGWNEINPYTGKIPLEIEHKDGNYQNNSEDNLELLCPNCHSLTSTYKGANKGHGRLGRSKYNLPSNQ